ncbi:MAG: hypothetical protein P8J42_07915 [Pseudomonadales bacterium]|nr:hypothetical protein [Pseudomonadales bacterium]
MNRCKTGADSNKVATEYQNYGKLWQLGPSLSDILAALILQRHSFRPSKDANNLSCKHITCFINPDIEVSTWSQL